MFNLFRLCLKDEISFDTVAKTGNIVAETGNIVAQNVVFYPDTLGLGGNTSQHWREDVGSMGAVPPAGSRGRAPGQGVWPPEAGSFLLHTCITIMFTD